MGFYEGCNSNSCPHRVSFFITMKRPFIKWQKFWLLTTLKELESVWYNRKILCECDCWNLKIAVLSELKRWKTKHCWCDRKCLHWMAKTRIYKIWKSMKQRCFLKSSPAYINYWWRWISIDPLWKNSFTEFYKDMWASYKEWLTIDRIDVNWNYSKENCRWATIEEQNRNKRTSIIPWWLKKFCREKWISYMQTYNRIKKEWPWFLQSFNQK